MKKIFFSLLILFAVALTSSASELLNIPYKNIKEEDKPIILLVDDNTELLSMLEDIFLPMYNVYTCLLYTSPSPRDA